jgi:preprotein translocase subunit YajC
MLIATAYAQAAEQPAASDPLGGIGAFLPLILIFVVFYFLLIRPQQRKAKAHKELVANVRRGDRVVTQGGIIGTVAKIASDTEVMVEIAEGVRVRVLKSTLSDVVSRAEVRDEGNAKAAKGEPAKAAEGEKTSSSGGDRP